MISKMVADHHIDEANREGTVEFANCGKLVGSRVDSGQIMGRDHSYRSRTVCRRSSSGHGLYTSPLDGSFKLSKLLVIVVQLLFLSSFCRGGLQGGGFGSTWVRPEAGRLMLSSATSVSNYCTKFYTTVQGETCASLRASSGLSQSQIYEVNPRLNCKTLSKGQSVCVEGISVLCARTISVTKGSTNSTCASIRASSHLSAEGFSILNPGISCPEASGNHNAWPKSQLVCVAPGLGNLFAEYIGDSGLPITFAQVQPLYQKYSSVITHVILAFVVETDANGTRTNGVFHPHWNSALTPAGAKAFKAANPNVRLLISLGGASWEDPGAQATQWIDTAQASLAAIATEYSIDGIDIAYVSFPQGSANFAYCVGTLVQQLKGNNTIGLATIAPAGSVMSDYMSILSTFSDQVDYVNFQFYSYQLLTVESYIVQFQNIADKISPWKLLASTQIGGTNCITGPSFLEAVEKIQLARGLPGVMMFDADHSVGKNFQDENLVLSLLNGEPYSNITNSTTLGPSLAPSPSSSLGPAKSPSPIAPGSSQAPAPGAPHSRLAPGPLAPGSSKAPAPGAPHSSLAPGSSKAPALGPGTPHSSLAPGSSKAPALGPGAPHSSLAPGSSKAPAPGPGAPHSSLAPGSSKAPALGPGAPHSSLAPGSSKAPALGPGAPHSSSTPRLAPGSSLAPGSGAPGSSPAVGSAGAPGSSAGTLAPPASSPSSAPKRLLGGRAWSSQGFGLVTAVFFLLFSL